MNNMDLVVWENHYDRIYLIYRFQKNGMPDPTCRVYERKQGCPQKHMLTLVKDGVEILSKVKGKCLETGMPHLPCQRYNTTCKDGFIIMGERDMVLREPSKSLPKRVTMQYENILVLWELHPYIVIRDYAPHKKSVYVYSPIKITLKD